MRGIFPWGSLTKFGHESLWAFGWPLLALDSDNCLLGLSIITGNKVDSTVLLQVLFPSSTTPRRPSVRPLSLLPGRSQYSSNLSASVFCTAGQVIDIDTVATSPAPWCDDFVHVKIIFHERILFTWQFFHESLREEFVHEGIFLTTKMCACDDFVNPRIWFMRGFLFTR
jgi:hypothetical protein